jgi:hypothetical protein
MASDRSGAEVFGAAELVAATSAVPPSTDDSSNRPARRIARRFLQLAALALAAWALAALTHGSKASAETPLRPVQPAVVASPVGQPIQSLRQLAPKKPADLPKIMAIRAVGKQTGVAKLAQSQAPTSTAPLLTGLANVLRELASAPDVSSSPHVIEPMLPPVLDPIRSMIRPVLPGLARLLAAPLLVLGDPAVEGQLSSVASSAVDIAVAPEWPMATADRLGLGASPNAFPAAQRVPANALPATSIEGLSPVQLFPQPSPQVPVAPVGPVVLVGPLRTAFVMIAVEAAGNSSLHPAGSLHLADRSVIAQHVSDEPPFSPD